MIGQQKNNRTLYHQASLVAQLVKNLPAMQETWVQSLGRSPREGNGTHSSILAWGIPRTEEPGGLQAMGSQRVGHDHTTFTFTLSFPSSSTGKESASSAGDLGLISGLGRSLGDGNGYPPQYSGLENSTDCIVHGVAKSRTRPSDFHFQAH